MLQAYVEVGMQEHNLQSLHTPFAEATKLPAGCGLMTSELLESLRFDGLKVLGLARDVQDSFLTWLRDFPSQDVHAVQRITPVSPTSRSSRSPHRLPKPSSPKLLSSIRSLQTTWLKAARVVTAARGHLLVDFGARRASTDGRRHQSGASVLHRRRRRDLECLAGKIYGLPVLRTMAHSFVQADDEKDAFRSFVRLYPDTVLLVDTYDTAKGVGRVCELARELGDQFKVKQCA
jgi:nicotinate phosphoribosyltransferase